MARVLVSIDDPLDDGSGLPLLLGSFVDVAVAAAPIERAVKVPRAALRGGDTIFVMNDDDLLEIRTVQIGWTEPDVVLVTGGLGPRERVVVSRIPTPVPNMRLRTATRRAPAETAIPSEAAASTGP